MKNDSPEGTEIILDDTTSTAAQLQAELDEMRHRLAALEARAPAQANLTVGRKRHWRATPKRLALLIVGVMLAGATIVFGQGAVDALFVSKDGKVGIGTTDPASKLSVVGNADVSGDVSVGTTGSANKLSVLGNTDVSGNLSVTGSLGVGTIASANRLSVAGNADFGGNVGMGTNAPTSRLSIIDAKNTVAGQQLRIGSSAGATDYTMGRNPTTGFLDFSGSQTGFVGYTFSNGSVGIGTTTPRAKLDVAGTIISQGRYQRNDSAEATYEISPRYHLSLTQNVYDGRTRQIPQQVIIDLCADYDGCQFRLGMTQYAAGSGTETASITGIMYYSTIDSRWRSSRVLQGKDLQPADASGIDGNKRTEHVADAWATCFFTDSPYSGYRDQSDPTVGMYLLLWNGYTNPGRTCELTLID